MTDEVCLLGHQQTQIIHMIQLKTGWWYREIYQQPAIILMNNIVKPVSRSINPDLKH